MVLGNGPDDRCVYLFSFYAGIFYGLAESLKGQFLDGRITPSAEDAVSYSYDSYSSNGLDPPICIVRRLF